MNDRLVCYVPFSDVLFTSSKVRQVIELFLRSAKLQSWKSIKMNLFEKFNFKLQTWIRRIEKNTAVSTYPFSLFPR